MILTAVQPEPEHNECFRQKIFSFSSVLNRSNILWGVAERGMGGVSNIMRFDLESTRYNGLVIDLQKDIETLLKTCQYGLDPKELSV